MSKRGASPSTAKRGEGTGALDADASVDAPLDAPAIVASAVREMLRTWPAATVTFPRLTGEGWRRVLAAFGPLVVPRRWPLGIVVDQAADVAAIALGDDADVSLPLTMVAHCYPATSTLAGHWRRQRSRPRQHPLVCLVQGPSGDGALNAHPSPECHRILTALHDALNAFESADTHDVGIDEVNDVDDDDDDDEDDDVFTDQPTRAQHALAVDDATRAFAEGRLHKVVLARRRRRAAHLTESVGLRLLVALGDDEPTGILWARFDGEHLDDVVGCSPEHLVVRHGNTLTLDALAGSLPRNLQTKDDASEDDAALLTSAKDRHEHQVVKDMILASLRDVLGARLESIDAPASPVVKHLGRLSHLHTPIVAKLAASDGENDKGDDEKMDRLVDVLHPTPAVGGTPREGAIAFQAQHEGFDRGLYAGVLRARFPGLDLSVVALRGAHLHDDVVDIYAGGGLVAGSVAETEWRELDTKCAGVEAAWRRVHAPSAADDDDDDDDDDDIASPRRPVSGRGPLDGPDPGALGDGVRP